jgi:hypothetical protein
MRDFLASDPRLASEAKPLNRDPKTFNPKP